MSLFAHGILSDAAHRDLIEVAAYLDTVIRPEMTTLMQHWTAARGARKDEAFHIQLELSILAGSLSMAAGQVQRVLDTLREDNAEVGGTDAA